MLPAIAASAVSAVAFAVAIAMGLRAADNGDGLGWRSASEPIVAFAAGIAILFLLIAAIFWARYLIFGPLQDAIEALRMD